MTVTETGTKTITQYITPISETSYYPTNAYFKGAYFNYIVTSSTLAPPEGTLYHFEIVESDNKFMEVMLKVKTNFTTTSTQYVVDASWKGLVSKIFEGKNQSFEYVGREKIDVKSIIVDCEKYAVYDKTTLFLHSIIVYVYKNVPVKIIESYKTSIAFETSTSSYQTPSEQVNSATLTLMDTNAIVTFQMTTATTTTNTHVATVISTSDIFTRFEKLEITSAYANSATEIVINVKNTGSADATITDISINSKPLSAVSGSAAPTLPISMPSDSSTTITLTFTPGFSSGVTVSVTVQTASGTHYAGKIVIP